MGSTGFRYLPYTASRGDNWRRSVLQIRERQTSRKSSFVPGLPNLSVVEPSRQASRKSSLVPRFTPAEGVKPSPSTLLLSPLRIGAVSAKHEGSSGEGFSSVPHTPYCNTPLAGNIPAVPDARFPGEVHISTR